MTNSTLGAGPHGYSLPLSPSGNAAMITPPPWHFAGDILLVEYRVDPEAAASFLPPGLWLGTDPGAAAAVFADWQWCSASGAELADPSRCQFTEFLLLIGCAFGDVAMARCPYAWVDQPVPMMRGWIQGMPKQLGAIWQTRIRPVGAAGSPLAAGTRLAGVASAFGTRLAEAAVTLRSDAVRPPVLHTVPLVHSRLFPAWVPSGHPVSELVSSEVTDVRFADVWRGQAELRLLPGDDLDLRGLAPVSVGTGYSFRYAETLHGGKSLDLDLAAQEMMRKGECHEHQPVR